MPFERLRTFAFLAVMAIVLTLASVAVWQKSVDCGEMGGKFTISGFRAARLECRLPDGLIREM